MTRRRILYTLARVALAQACYWWREVRHWERIR
jgi:hypothetical protein